MQTHLKERRVWAKQTPRVGHVVLIKENLPRGTWRIGKIIELVPSQDGETRAAKIQLPSQKILSRTLNMLCPLECTDYAEAQPTNQNTKLKELIQWRRLEKVTTKLNNNPSDEQLFRQREKLRVCLGTSWGSHFTLSWGASQAAQVY